MNTAQKTILLLSRQSYNQYINYTIRPTAWWSLSETSGSIADNAAYIAAPGAELLTNGSFAAWTADNPDGWTVDETPPLGEIAESPAGQCNIISDSTLAQIRQAVLTAGNTYRSVIDVTAITGTVIHGTSGSIVQAVTTTGIKSFDFIADQISYSNRRSGSCNVSIDSASVKLVGQLDAANTAATVGQAGKLGTAHAYDFDGATSLLTVANSATLANLTTWTYAWLVNPDTAGELSFGRFFDWNGDSFYVRFEGALTAIRCNVNGLTTDAFAVTSTGLTASQWAWVFITFDNSGDRIPHIYKGMTGAITEYGYSSSTAMVGTYITPTGNLIIGNLAAASTTFDGLMDEAFIVNRVLTTAEMQTLVNLTGV